jgi:drug/metabolite transporter (DMT)-like permease
MSLPLLAFCIVAEIGRELCFKAGANATHDQQSFARSLAASPILWVGIVLWAVEVIAWVIVLERAPLGLAYPVMTLTYAGVPLAGVLFLRERLQPAQMAGAALVALGVTCVALSGH